jgi:hypothetical protein
MKEFIIPLERATVRSAKTVRESEVHGEKQTQGLRKCRGKCGESYNAPRNSTCLKKKSHWTIYKSVWCVDNFRTLSAKQRNSHLHKPLHFVKN